MSLAISSTLRGLSPLGRSIVCRTKPYFGTHAALRRAGAGRGIVDDLLGGAGRLGVVEVDEVLPLGVGRLEGDERVAVARRGSTSWNGSGLAGGVDDAVVAAVGPGPALAEDLDAAHVAAGVGRGLGDLDDGAGVPAGEVPGVGRDGREGRREEYAKSQSRSHGVRPHETRSSIAMSLRLIVSLRGAIGQAGGLRPWQRVRKSLRRLGGRETSRKR